MKKTYCTALFSLSLLFISACSGNPPITENLEQEPLSTQSQPSETEKPMPTSKPATASTPLEPTVTTLPGERRTSSIDGMNQVYIPGELVHLGCEDGTPFCFGLERYQLALAPYWIDETEVTNAMYAAFLNGIEVEPEKAVGFVNVTSDHILLQHEGEGWLALEGYENHPVVEVLWLGAEAYCTWAERRLPFAAEWEHAARGPDELIFTWGNEKPDSYKVNFCDTNCSMGVTAPDYSRNDRYERTAPVGTYPEGASPYGVLDLAGNALEWVWDWELSPALALTTKRVTKGGSYNSTLSNMASFERGPIDATSPWSSSGFRCAVDAADFGHEAGFPQGPMDIESLDSSLLGTEDIEDILRFNGIPVPEWLTDQESFSADIQPFLLSTEFNGAAGTRWFGVSDQGYISLRVFVYRHIDDFPENIHSVFPVGRCELEEQSEGEWYLCGRTYETGSGIFQHARGVLLFDSLWIEVDYNVQDPSMPMNRSWLDVIFDMLMAQFALAG